MEEENICFNRRSNGEVQVAAGDDKYGGAIGDDEIGRCDIRGAKDVRDETGELRAEQGA